MLRHDNIVKVVDFGIDEDTELAYLVMQKLDGNLLMNIPLHSIDDNMKEERLLFLYIKLLHIYMQ